MFTQPFYKKSLCLLLVGAGLLLLAGPLWAAYRVTNLEVSRVDGGVAVTIEADAPLSYSYFTIDEPEPRLVVDFFDAVHGLPKFRFDDLGTRLLSGIRTSQYRPYPQPSVRVVLDMPRLLAFQMFHFKGEDNRLVILLEAISDSVSAAKEPFQAPPEVAVQPEAEVLPEEQGQVVEEPVEAPPEVAVQPKAEVPPEEQDQVVEEPVEALVSPPDSARPQAVVPSPEKPEKTAISRLFALGIREPVAYSSGGRRDPFVPLPAGQETEFGQAPLPDAEKLTIVGILLGANGYRALAQDEDQNGYVLRKGDRVLYGYVARIEQERVVFRLSMRGLDRTVIVKLPQ